MYRNCLYLLRYSPNIINQKKLETSIIKRWAGHSKWQNIKGTKEAADAAKSLYITKLNHRLPIAIKEGGGSMDPEKNAKVKALLNEARANNIPKESIEKIIKRVAAVKDAKPTYLCVRGPRNLLFTLEIITVSMNKTRLDVAGIAKRFNFQVEPARDGSLEFVEKGIVKCKPLNNEENAFDKALEHAIEVNAEEVTEDEEKNLVFECSTHNVDQIREELEKLGYTVNFADCVMKFSEQVELTDAEVELCEKFVGKLSNLSEIVKVSDNIV